VQRAYARWLAAGLAAETVRLHHGVLHRALDRAVRWGLLRSNPCDAVEPPKRARAEMATWTAEQAAHVLAATDDDRLAALWRLAVLTGMRRGELLALRWADVDLARATVSVRRTLTRGPTGLTIGEPKSAAGQRAVALPPSCVAALRRHRACQDERRRRGGEAWVDTGLIFDRGDGQLLHPNVVWAAFRRLVARRGVPLIRFHDLRHTSATLALEQGIHPKVVAERLGHSDISMTLNRYSHVAAEMQRAAAARLDDLLRRLEATDADAGSGEASADNGDEATPPGGAENLAE
jgi:integrase